MFKRLSAVLPTFTKEQETFAIQHTGRRNAELHSGESAFEGVKGSKWQPRFYKTCDVLLGSMNMNLEDFIGVDEAKIATQLVAAAADESARAVKGDVDAHRKVWLGKSDPDRATLLSQAELWAKRQDGHRVKCPACNAPALVFGDPLTAPVRKLSENDITETQEYLPNHFECIACSLKISGLSRLAAVDLADRYKQTQFYDAAAYYAPEDQYSAYEDDNNEP